MEDSPDDARLPQPRGRTPGRPRRSVHFGLSRGRARRRGSRGPGARPVSSRAPGVCRAPRTPTMTTQTKRSVDCCAIVGTQMRSKSRRRASTSAAWWPWFRQKRVPAARIRPVPRSGHTTRRLAAPPPRAVRRRVRTLIFERRGVGLRLQLAPGRVGKRLLAHWLPGSSRRLPLACPAAPARGSSYQGRQPIRNSIAVCSRSASVSQLGFCPSSTSAREPHSVHARSIPRAPAEPTDQPLRKHCRCSGFCLRAKNQRLFFICREVEVRIRMRLGLGLGLGESRVRVGPKRS